MGIVNTLSQLGQPAEYLSQWVGEMKAQRQAEEEQRVMGLVHTLLQAKTDPNYNPGPEEVAQMFQQAGVDPQKRPDIFQKVIGTVQQYTKWAQERQKFQQTQEAVKEGKVRRQNYENNPTLANALKQGMGTAVEKGDSGALATLAETQYKTENPKPPESDMQTIYGPNGQTQRVSIPKGSDYTPPTGFSLKAPDKPEKPERPDEWRIKGQATNIEKRIDVLDKESYDLEHDIRRAKAGEIIEGFADPKVAYDILFKRHDDVVKERAKLQSRLDSIYGGGGQVTGATAATGEGNLDSNEASLRLNLRRAIIAMNNGDEQKAATLSENADVIQKKMGLSQEEFKRIADEEVARAGGQATAQPKVTAKNTVVKNEIAEALKTYKPQPQATSPVSPQPMRQPQPQPAQAALGPQSGPGFGGMRPELFAPTQPSQVVQPQENLYVKQVAMMRTEDLMKLRATERNPAKQRIIAMELQKRQQAERGL